LFWQTCPPKQRPLVQGWKHIRSRLGLVPHTAERSVPLP
jgi:hypothetical protein